MSRFDEEERRYADQRRGEGEGVKDAQAREAREPAPIDDFERMRLLWLRLRERDLSEKPEILLQPQPGALGWEVSIDGGDPVPGRMPTEIAADQVKAMARRLLLRARSDVGVLRLCGIAFALDPADAATSEAEPPPEGVVIDERGIVTKRR